MCFDFDARPPDLPADLAPIAGGAAAEILELTSADGTRFSAALAESPEGRDPAVVILPDVRGLYRFYVELAERFADAGHHAIAIDFFGRTAGVGERDEGFEYLPHARATTVEGVLADALAARRALVERTGAGAVVTVGFCFGGMHSFLASTNAELDPAGVVGFYGGLSGERWGVRGPLARVAELRGPLLGLFGGADQGIPVEQVQEFERELEEAGVEKEIVVYPGAPHSFFDRTYDEHAEACADAWRRVLGFLNEVGGAGRPMSRFTHVNLGEVEDQAPKFGYGEFGEARFARGALDAARTGVSLQRLRPGVRQAFAHRHKAAEEVYVVLSGSGRIRVDDEIVELRPLDAIRIAPEATRQMEAGPEGLEVLAFGTAHEMSDAEMVRDFWT